MKAPYLLKECYVVGDENRMQDTIDWWWNHHTAREYKRFQEHFIGRICDVGCNIGMTTLLAAGDSRVSQVVGVDIFPAAVDAARRYAQFAELDHKVEYIVQDFTLECDQLEAESFDGVISFHTLEHIYPEDLDAFVVNVRRILKPDGKALICIPHKCAFDSPEHVSYFSIHALHALFVKHGFVVLELYVTDSGVVDYAGWDTAVLTGLFIKKNEVPILKFSIIEEAP